MFDKDGIKRYVGGNSGNSYSAGLTNIERKYAPIDIDEEFQKDECSSLLSRLEKAKFEPNLEQKEKSQRQDNYSHLKKYIYFKRYERFKTWLSEQPQKNDASKLYAEGTIQAAASCLHKGLSTLSAYTYKESDCFSITRADEFKKVYDKCYTEAEEYDNTHGHRDFRNGLDYYLAYLQGGTSAMGNQTTGTSISEKIEAIISKYKSDFEKVDAGEKYKWLAIGHYKEHWNIEADNFASMYMEAFKEAGNLLAAGMYYPYKMIGVLSERDPETVRSLFRMLYDETIDLSERYVKFRSGCDEVLTEYRESDEKNSKAMNHYQDLHAISVYLAFEYPEKYYIYKYKVYKAFRDRIEFVEEKNKSEVWKLDNYIRMCNLVLDVVNQDSELIELSKNRLDDSCYQDEAYHLLSMDVVYYGSKMEDKSELPAEVKARETQLVLEEHIPKNTILYGPPGTGKTYHTVIYAVAIIENKELEAVEAEDYSEVLKRYNEYKTDGFVEFTTFHQTYGYEEFIEGIKPIMQNDSDEQSDIQYEISAGLFKSFCDKAGRPVLKSQKADIGLNNSPTVWKVSLEGTGNNPTRTECMEKGHIRVGYDSYGGNISSDTNFDEGGKNVVNAFVYKMKIGDVILSCFSSTTIDAIGVVTGEYEWHDEYDHFKRLRKVNWIVKGIQKDITEINNDATLTLSSVYKLNIALADVMDIVAENAPAITDVSEKKKNYVFVIDEINRGNISKIFGELITLIEPSKRIGQPEGMKARLPYSQQSFGVPDNVYLIGTMNTADRSIATIDTALRRRFKFKEMMPDENVLKGVRVEDISIKDMLFRMNQRITLLYDREHTIGHAYFIALRVDPTIETLASIFSDNIIPLLQEYFYEDYEKIRLVLGDNNKSNAEEQFIVAKENDYSELFGNTDYGFDEICSYEINEAAFDNIEAYRSI